MGKHNRIAQIQENMVELPDGWVWARLEDIADIILGQSPPSSTYNEDGNGLPFYQGKLEFGKTYPTPRKWCTSPKKIAEKGDVLISVRAPVGPTNICPETSCIGRGLSAIRGLGGIETLFILYLMRSFENVIAGKGTGTTFKAITGNQLRYLDIPLPPLAEQHRIVAKIEELFTKLNAGVESLEKAKAQLKRYRQSVLKAVVEGKLTEEWRVAYKGELEPASVLLERILKERREKWEAEQLAQMKAKGKMPKDDSWKKKYKEPASPKNPRFTKLPEGWNLVSGDMVFWFITSGSRGWAKYYAESGSLFLRMGNLDHDSINLNLEKVQRVKPPVGAEGTRTRVIPGDILISITADVGMIALVPNNIEEAYINQHVALARSVPSVNQSYIVWFLASREGGQKQFLALQHGATKKGLGLDDVRAVNIPLPPFRKDKKGKGTHGIKKEIFKTVKEIKSTEDWKTVEVILIWQTNH